jgi:hypothetical protein
LRSDPRTFCTLLAKVLLEPVTDEPEEQALVSRVEMVIIDPKEQPWPAPAGRRLGEACAGGKAPTQSSDRGDDASTAMRKRPF